MDQRPAAFEYVDRKSGPEETEAAEVLDVSQPDTDYWLPWHVDSNFVTLLHREPQLHLAYLDILGSTWSTEFLNTNTAVKGVFPHLLFLSELL